MKTKSWLLQYVLVVCSFALSVALSPTLRGEGEVGPPTNANTAEGVGALKSLPPKNPGTNNTAIGYQTLFNNTAGSGSTAVGSQALYNNQTTSTADPFGDTTGQGTGIGYQALFSNTTGINNVAVGSQTLFSNNIGPQNVAIGDQALYSNIQGDSNNAVGFQALYSNVDGSQNNAVGWQALVNNAHGTRNTAIGSSALGDLTTGDSNTAIGNAAVLHADGVNYNTAIGRRALSRVVGDQNTALGSFAGLNLRGGGGATNNIYIGNVGPVPIGPESNTIRLGTQTATTATFASESHPMPAHSNAYIAGIYGVATSDAGSTTPVVIDMNGKLGTAASSERFKHDIKPMDKTSEALLSLKPVMFHYKNDQKDTPQFGLVAEEVAKVNPNLVVRDAKGEIYTVRYDAVNAMLLNEFLKEHKRVEQLESATADQSKEIAQLRGQLRKQAAAIQAVNDRVKINSAARRTVADAH